MTMAPSSISVPTLSIKSKSENITLTSTGELDIHVPDSCGTIGTAMELEQVVGEAQVWIAKQGLCHLMVDFSVNGIPISEADTLHHLETVMSRSDVWKRLELGLVLVTEPRGGRTNRISYSIQHPDLSSALAPPGTASVAAFRSVLYSIDLLTSQRRSISASKIEHGNDAETSTRIACSNDENEEYNNLASFDRIAVDDFLESMRTNFETFAPSSVPNKRRRLEDSRTDAAALSSDVQVLLSTWLEYVFWGRRRCSKTVALVQDIAPTPLSQLAPGVFDVAYLKNVSAKREFVSSISTCLARMSNAESPSLRKKVECLGAMVKGQSVLRTGDQSNHICASIELKIWNILAAGASGPKRRTGSRLSTTK